jgi:O-antigen ligase
LEPAVKHRSETRLLQSARWALYGTVAGLPLYVVRWHYGPLPTTLLESLIIVTVLLYGVARWRDGMRRPSSTPYDVPIVLLLVAGAISVFVATDHRGALGLYRAYFIEPIAIYYVAADLLGAREHIQRFVVAFAAGSSAFAVLNLIVFLRALAAHNVHVGAAPNALYGDANYVAMYMEPPVAMAAGLLMLGGSAGWKRFGGTWLLITGSALAVMFSKGSYLALATLVVVAVITVPRWRIAIGVAVVAAVLVATQIPLAMQRLATVASSIGGREQIFGATVNILRAHPIFGIGLGGYSYQFRGATPEIYPHDIWLTFWVELGILGVVAFALILFGLLWRGWRAWPLTDGLYRSVLWGVLGALVLWTVHGLVDSPYWKNDMSTEFWLLAAVQLVILRAVKRPAAS